MADLIIGVDQNVVNNVFKLAKPFFDEPMEVKLETDYKNNPHNRGYIPLYHNTANEKRKGNPLTS